MNCPFHVLVSDETDVTLCGVENRGRDQGLSLEAAWPSVRIDMVEQDTLMSSGDNWRGRDVVQERKEYEYG